MKRPAAALLGCIAVVLLIAVAGVATIPTVPTGTWHPMGSMAVARSGAAALLLQDQRVLITGGNNGPDAVNSVEAFNADGSFANVSAMGTPRSEHVAALLMDGRVLVAGGVTAGGGTTNSAEIFDPWWDSWTTIAGGMVEARSKATAVLLQDGRVLIAGGQNGNAPNSTVEIFDPNTGQFSFAGSLSSPRMGLASAGLPDGRVLITGGSNGSVPVATSDVFDPTTNTVSAGPAMTSPRVGHSATSLLDGRVLVAGGNNGSADLASAEVFDPAVGGFAVVASSLAAPRRDHTAILLPNNNAVLIVGGTSAGNEVNTAETFLPWADTFAATGAPAVARQHATVSALNQDGLLVMAGGSSAGVPTNSAELYGFATVKTDLADYAPGSVVTITGSGWQPGETVALTLVETPYYDTHPVMTAVADGQGRITNAEFSPDEHDVGIRFYLTAAGSQSQAQTTFTDNLKIAVSRDTPTAANVSQATGASFTVTFAISNNNNGGDASTKLGGTWSLTKTGGLTTSDSTSGTFNNLSTSTPLLLTFHFTAPATPETGDTISLTANITSPACLPGGGNTCSDTVAYTVGIFAPPAISKSFSPSSMNVGGTSSLNFTLTNNNGTALTAAAFSDPLPAGVQVAATPSALNGCGGTFAPTAGATTISLGGGTIPANGTCSLSVNVTGTTAGTKNNTTGAVTATPGGGLSLIGNTASSTLMVNSTVPTTLALNSINPNSVAYGSSGPVTFTATLTRNDTSAAVVGATVNFTVDGGAAGTAVTGASGVATFSTYNPSGLSAATHNVASTFSAATISGVQYGASNSGTLALTVGKATPTITWANPADITYGTALGATQLNAAASVPGTFVYTPGAGTVLNAGSGQTLHVDFTPTDTANYVNASGNVLINVLKATPTVTWANPADISYGTALSGTQLDATFSWIVNGSSVAVAGTAVYSPASGTVLSAGNGQNLTVNFTPTDTTNYNAATKTVQINVLKATPTVTVSFAASPITYDGDPHPPIAAVAGVGGADLTSGHGTVTVAYTPGPGAPVNAGSYTASAHFQSSDSNYNDADSSVLAALTIEKAASVTTVSCPANVTYDGTPQTPCTVSVTGPGGLNLTPTPTYGNNVNAGTATASYAYGGDTNHNGSSDTKNFTIDKAASITMVSCPASVTFDGSAQEPCTATVTGAGGLNQTLTVSYSNNTNAGTAGASASFAGDANHTGSSDSKSFTIEKAASVTSITCPANVTYNGSAQTPCSANVTGAGGLNQVLTVSYSENTNAGTATASASFPGDANHTGSADTKTFTIDKAPSVTAVTCPADVTYNGSPQTPCSASVTGAGGLSETLTVGYSNNTDAGTATASASYAGDANHTGSSDSKNFTIDKAPSATTVTCPVSVTYTGAALEPCTASVTGAGGLNLTPIPTYNNNVNAGTATASNNYPGDANHTGSSDSKIFTIDKAPSVTTVICPTNVTYTGLPLTPCTANVTGAGGFNQALAVSYTNNTNAGTAGASAFFAGDANHTGSSDSKTFTIDKAPSVTAVTCPVSVTYNGTAQTPCTAMVTGVGGLSQSVLVSYSNNTNSGTAGANASFAGDANHHGSSDSKTFTIAKANPTINVTPYNAAYDGLAHTATGTAKGVQNESLTGLNLTGTTHTLPGDYPSDAWVFTDVTGNYNSTSGTLHNSIGYGVCTAGPGGVVLPPINSDGSSVYQRKGGSTIPVKFRVCAANGSAISNPAAVFAGTGGTLTMLSAVRGTVDAINETTGTDIPDAAFRWDGSGQQWIFNMATNNLSSGNTYLFRVNLANGSIQFVVGVK